MIGDFDSTLRVVSLGAWLVLLAQFAGVPMRGELRFALVLFALAEIAALLAGGGLLAAASAGEPTVLLLAALAPFAAWLAALRLFGQAPEPRTVLVAGLAVLGTWAAARYAGEGGEPAFYALRVLSVLLAADIARAAITGRKHDTLPPRRALRAKLGPLAALQAGLLPLAEIISGSLALAPGVSLAHGALTLALALVLALALFEPERAILGDASG